jgi:hypothetical protein
MIMLASIFGAIVVCCIGILIGTAMDRLADRAARKDGRR